MLRILNRYKILYYLNLLFLAKLFQRSHASNNRYYIILVSVFALYPVTQIQTEPMCKKFNSSLACVHAKRYLSITQIKPSSHCTLMTHASKA